MLHIPSDFAVRMRNVHGVAGAEWIEGLPSLIETCEELWSFEAVAAEPMLSYNYLVRGRLEGGAEAMLKVGVPHRELFSEMDALKVFDGQGCVRLLGVERDLGAMLLDYVTPGNPLSGVDDDELATRIACEVVKRLRRPAPENSEFPTVAKLAQGLEGLRERFDGGTGPFLPAMVDRAERRFEDLIGSTENPELLHGDFHHDNVLASDAEGWIAIDPKGVIGDPAYGLANFLGNPGRFLVTTPRPKEVLEGRVEVFASELGLDYRRILEWGFCHAVLSGWWCVEDNVEGVDYGIACAELMDSLLD